jgi:FKBP-type peptidyl-prolyl cis-trans isomerase FkpA
MKAWTILGIVASCALAGGCGSDSSGLKDLQLTDLVVGTGATVVASSTVKVDYTGWLYDDKAPDKKGQQFDTSIGKQPLQFIVGGGAMITGFERGMLGMRVGGQRRLFIPADLAYGSAGAGGVIPPNAAVVFDVTLLDASRVIP